MIYLCVRLYARVARTFGLYLFPTFINRTMQGSSKCIYKWCVKCSCPFRYDIVPVVMGAHPDDYKRVAPPGSYIHVEEFAGPKELAKYLQTVADNDVEYNKYFRWKEAGSFIDTKFWCRICSMLWDPVKPRRSVADLNLWWRGEGVCIDTRRWDSLKTDTI